MSSLGLPDGSVRALAMLASLGGATYMWVTQKPITDFEQAMVTVAVTYYFATRSAESPAQPAVDPPNDPPNLDAVDLLAKQRGIKP